MPRVNLIGWDNGVGLSRDLRLIEHALREAGLQVHLQPARGRGKLRKWFGPWLQRARLTGHRLLGRERYDLNIMLEHVKPEYLQAAERNAFIPNPEWCLPADVRRLRHIDRVMTKTRHAEPIFQRHGCGVSPIGFTSGDRHLPGVERQRSFLHLAGRSSAKRTRMVMETWARHPEWPVLTVVQHPRMADFRPQAANIVHRVDYLDDAELRELQNANLFHLCPSETEGFGHYIVEALSVGAIVLTTDAEPMNELVTPERGILMPFARTDRQQLATRYLVEADALEAAVASALAMDDTQVHAKQDAARTFFLDNDAAFRSRLVDAVVALAGNPAHDAATSNRPPVLATGAYSDPASVLPAVQA
jgi:glycosyltransferase involved in cell wall biosynthesis